MGQAMTKLIGPNRVAERSTNDQKPGESRSEGRDGKFVFSVLHAVKCAENIFISHTKAPHRAASIGVITAPSNTNHWNHLPNLLSGSVWQSVVTYHRFYDREGWKKMQITYHTPHTSLKLIFRFFFFQSVCHQWLVCVFTNLIWRRVKLSRKN